MKNIFTKIIYYFRKEIEGNEKLVRIFGILFFINYPVYYIVWTYGAKQSYENFWLRMFASLLCIPLIYINYWPEPLKLLRSYYWSFVVTFCLPFFFSYMTLRNDISIVWLLNLMLAIFLSLILLDLSSWLISMFIGFIGAYVGYVFLAGIDLIYKPGTLDLTSGLATFIAAIGVAGILLYYKEKSEKEKMMIVRSISDNIAHELRTPLASIKMSVSGIKNYLPKLINSHQKATESNLSVDHITNSQIKGLVNSVEYIQTEINFANTFITMLLTKAAHPAVGNAEHEACNISDCVDKALERYPFHEGQRSLVEWSSNQSFEFAGSEILTIHVLFNLMKNSLHYISSKAEGKIKISVELGENYNLLHFYDNGSGISQEDRHRIFDNFYSKTVYGTGVGLSFCKTVMQFFNGDITVESIVGEYTEFTLKFPCL
ncbi:MAG: HAMP domain-containing histidine kinase [Flavobacteriales bacterium]|nr:HAMP domain-containing histidine kinase [Flavobacteriales bacterium]